MSQHLGRHIRVWFDNRPLVPAESFTAESMSALGSSALMLAILSPSFLNSQHSLGELETFLETNGTDRVVKVKRLPSDEPHGLAELSPFLFYRRTSEGLMQGLVDEHYRRAVQNLAQHIALLLKGMASSGPEVSHDSGMSVFLCHSSGDREAVRALWSRLKSDGLRPWLDETDIPAGVKWEPAIQAAIDEAGAIVVCLSSTSIGKEGYLQRELRMVLDRAAEMLDDTVFLIPARLEACEVPRRLREYQWVDMFDVSGYPRLVQALRMRARALASRSGS